MEITKNSIRGLGLAGLLFLSPGKTKADDLVNDSFGKTGVQIESTVYRPLISSNENGKYSQEQTTEESRYRLFAKTGLSKKIFLSLDVNIENTNTLMNEAEIGSDSNLEQEFTMIGRDGSSEQDLTKRAIYFPISLLSVGGFEIGAGPKFYSKIQKLSALGHAQGIDATYEYFNEAGYKKENNLSSKGFGLELNNRKLFPFNLRYSDLRGKERSSEKEYEKEDKLPKLYGPNDQPLNNIRPSDYKERARYKNYHASIKNFEASIPLTFNKIDMDISYGVKREKLSNYSEEFINLNKTVGIRAGYSYKNFIIGAKYDLTLSSEKKTSRSDLYTLDENNVEVFDRTIENKTKTQSTYEKLGLFLGFTFGGKK